jgi:NCS1 family nucleobase:cation symporter-1
MALYSFIGVAVTSATLVIFGKTIWNPVDLLTTFKNPLVLMLAMLAICIATLATNLAANVVSPANDFSHLAPKFISFRTGGLITGLIGILIQPWRLLADPHQYIFTWLGGYSSLLGAIGGVLIVDYVFLRRGNLNLPKLYQPDGPYWYAGGFNPIAIVSLALGVGLCVPGFLATIGWIHVNDFWAQLYSYAWFVSFGVAGVCYGAVSVMTVRVKER